VKPYTVIIPAYNEERSIGEVIKQTQKFADEVIVVDDSSTDNTKELCERLGSKVVTNEHKKGYIGAIREDPIAISSTRGLIKGAFSIISFETDLILSISDENIPSFKIYSA